MVQLHRYALEGDSSIWTISWSTPRTNVVLPNLIFLDQSALEGWRWLQLQLLQLHGDFSLTNFTLELCNFAANRETWLAIW